MPLTIEEPLMKKHRRIFARIIAAALVLSTLDGGETLAGNAPELTQGQTVYVPVYSEVPYGNADRNGKPAKWLLSATLTIRNTDPFTPLTLRSIRYFDTDGNVIRDYPTGDKIGPLGTREIFVPHSDQSGGSGANFIVVWDAEKAINAPIIEAIHAYFFDSRGLVFVSPSQALHVEDR
jgi:hypothetical protein